MCAVSSGAVSPEAAGALGWLGEEVYAAPGLRAEVQVGDLA